MGNLLLEKNDGHIEKQQTPYGKGKETTHDRGDIKVSLTGTSVIARIVLLDEELDAFHACQEYKIQQAQNVEGTCAI